LDTWIRATGPTDLAGGSRFGYTLLSVILLSNLMAMLLQALALKLGIATGRDLAQACRDHYSRPVSFVLWVLCEIAIAACDLAEVIGSPACSDGVGCCRDDRGTQCVAPDRDLQNVAGLMGGKMRRKKTLADQSMSRRDLLKAGALGTVGMAAAGSVLSLPGLTHTGGSAAQGQASHHDMMTVGNIGPGAFDPTAFLRHFDTGRVSRLPSGQTVREYDFVAEDREIEVAPGVFYPAWTYNGQVPGPTIRCTEGDRIRVRFTNRGSHSHSIHFHGMHPSNMDGAFEPVHPGRSFVYEFNALPFGLHLYHCHTVPIKRHIHKGLYGAFIVDPKSGRPPAQELVMVMNGFDTNFDNENEVYAVNSVAFHYQKNPIRVRQGELIRVYVVNVTEFDLLNSFHIHGNLFRLYRTGTDLTRYEWTDVVALCQGERAVLEFTYNHPGPFMFHAHQSEFAELGWSGVFLVEPPHV
jgi:manganese oxidase